MYNIGRLLSLSFPIFVIFLFFFSTFAKSLPILLIASKNNLFYLIILSIACVLFIFTPTKKRGSSTLVEGEKLSVPYFSSFIMQTTFNEFSEKLSFYLMQLHLCLSYLILFCHCLWFRTWRSYVV